MPFIPATLTVSMSKAFVLLNCDVGSEKDVVTKMRGIDGVTQASNVSGIYDVIAELSSDSENGIASLVRRFRLIASVRSCLTMIVAERVSTKEESEIR
jgi:hypothetical protein